MHIYLTPTANFGHAKAFLLREMLSKAAQAQHQIVDSAEVADLIIVLGNVLPNNAQFNGKKVFLAKIDEHFNAPENLLDQAIQQAQDYVPPAESAVVSNGKMKNIVAVTACPTGVAHTFMSAEAIETYAKQQDWAKAWALLPALRPHLAEAEYSTRQKTYAKGLLHDTATRESVEALEAAWKRLPAEVRRDKDMILQYAGALVENDHPEEAEKLLAAEIRQTQDLEYIQAYSQLRRANFRAQLEHMKQWENKHTNDAIFLYAKALIAYKAKELDIALAAIEEAVKRSQTQEAFALYAQILEAKNRPEAALVAYRQSVAPLHPEQALDGDLLPAPEAEAPKPDDVKTS